MTRLLVAIVVIACVATGAGQAAAQDEDGGGDEHARELFELGDSAFQDGRYEDALGYFQRAHELSGRPELVFNIGSSLERLGRTREAIDAYERFLRERPDAGNRTLVEDKIAVLEQSLSRSEEPVTDDDGGGLGIWPWVTLGAGAVIAGVSVLFYIAALGAEQELADGCGMTHSCTAAQIDATNGPTFVTLTHVFLVASIATLALGTTLLVIDLTSGSGDDDSAAAELRLGPASISLAGAF
jgi:tetratricopeptide (TPR) repeat protein